MLKLRLSMGGTKKDGGRIGFRSGSNRMMETFRMLEKAAQDLGEENIKKAEENLKKGQFSMEDYLSQLRQMKKMGGIEGIMSFMPGVSKIKSQMDSAGIEIGRASCRERV